MIVLPKIQANQAGAADALMLDEDGFVSETNATNVFMVKRSVVFTPCADSCLPGLSAQRLIEYALTHFTDRHYKAYYNSAPREWKWGYSSCGGEEDLSC